jgi:hypothetical protein
MRPWNFVVLFLSLTLFPSATVLAADAPSDLGANAAMKYWQAFAMLPTLDRGQQKILQEWNKVPLDAATRQLVERSDRSRTYLYRGAKLPHCDWSLDYQDGILLVLPHGPRAMTLARLAGLHARQEFEQGHGKAGWKDVTAVLKLARHVERDPMLIIRLLGYRIEMTAIEAAAPYLPELKPVLPEAASADLDALPARPTLPQAILKEKQVGALWLIQALKKAEQHRKGSWQDVWKAAFAWTNSHESNDSDREAVRSIKTFAQAIKRLEDLLPAYDRLAKLAALPWKEFDAQYPEFIKKTKAANPLATLLLPAMDRIAAAERRHQAQMALFKAALVVVKGGTDRLKDVKDPFGKGPFEYRTLGKGFELKSKFHFRGKPVTLRVGTGKKQ